ncbi:His/Gly/Thr/Pro-type tRNA ligase C-terminal domain-containing protein, partial [Bacillus pumilus]
RLEDDGFDVLFDYRQVGAGVKFADRVLIWLPIRISCGKRSEEGIVEVKFRKSGESHEVSVDELISFIRQA